MSKRKSFADTVAAGQARMANAPDAAIDLFSKALTLPDAADYGGLCHHQLGLCLASVGRGTEAVDHYRAALSLGMADATGRCLADLGATLRAIGEPGGAVMVFQSAITVAPDLLDAGLGLASALRDCGRFDEAAATMVAILKQRPTDPLVNLTFAVILSDMGYDALAVERYVAVHNLEPDNAFAGAALAKLIIAMKFDHLAPNVARYLLGPFQSYLAAVKAGDELAAMMGAAPAEAIDRLAAQSLPLDLMNSVPMYEPAIEKLLTALRRRLTLDDAILAATPPALVGALAGQCVINEYLFPEEPDELAAIDRVETELIRALADDRPIAPSRLAIYGAYRPPHRLPHADRLTKRSWPGAWSGLFKRMINEPLEERRLGETIPAITAIDDPASQAVRAQYEENPYPRWLVPETIPPLRVAQVVERLSGGRLTTRRNFPARPKVLVAGCGTGQQALAAASLYRDGAVLAVDISRASLAYALRKTRELGVGGIEYRHGDILNLASLGRSFDIVECGGVLHHMADPMAGWRVLVNLLRPGGLFRVAVYSETARTQVTSARKLIAELGLGQTPDDIRRFRAHIMALDSGDPLRDLLDWADFYTLGMCRDLAFHVEEHCFTIPRLAAAIRESGLTFLGFNVPIATLARYRQRFPHDATATDLATWEIFERENPATFKHLYQVFMQKP